MTIHLCQSSKKLSWSQIKQSILGRQRLVDKYNCGGCSRTFETICCLHFHCMKHCEGGSYYFDHVTNTAFPKFDMRCSATQFSDEDTSDITTSLKVLIGRARSINATKLIKVSSRYKKTNDTDIEQLVSSDIDSSEDIDGASFNVKNRQQKAKTKEANVSDGSDIETTAKHRKEREGFAFVKVRNIEKREDGSVTFEMNEDDAHLFQVTANTIIDQLKVNGGDILETEQEFKVQVPDDSLPQQDNTAEEAVTQVDEHSTSEPGSIQEPCSAVTGRDTLRESDVDSAGGSNITPEEREDSTYAVDPHREPKQFGKDNSDSERDTDESKGSGDTDIAKAGKTDAKDHYVNDAKKMPRSKKKIEESFDDTLDKKSLEQTNMKLSEAEVKVTKDKQEDSVVYTRSLRKRKLTKKMKESELPDIMKVTKRLPWLPEPKQKVENNVLALKERKRASNSGENDFNAGETLLSLRETGDLKQIKSSGCESVVINENQDEHFNVKMKRNIDIAKIVVNELVTVEKPDEKYQSDHVFANQLGEDEKIVGEENDLFDSAEKNDKMHFKAEKLNTPKNWHSPKKRRQKRQKVGKLPVCKRNDFKCEVCGKVGTLNMIRYHEQMHSDKMPYKCEECGKCFKTAACRRSHLLQHGEKKWKCDQCPAAFFRKQYLDVHMTKHTGEYPYVCELCGQKFKMAYIVRRHVNNVHKNIRNYKCDICDKEFFRVATRDQHRNRHFDPFLQCSYCPKKFKGDLDLRKHELTHTGEKMYFCPLCNQGFTQIWPYYKHMSKIHSIEKEEAKKIKIRNPDIVNMRNVNKNAAKKEPAYEHEFIGKPGCTFDMRKSFSQNVKRLKMIEQASENQNQCETYEYAQEMCDTNIQNETNRIYAETSSDVTDTIVLDIGEDLDTSETIVIQTEDVQNVDSQQTGYIVVENGHAGENIVIYSDLPQNEIEDVREYTAMDI